jgi:hypothetical protein
MLELGRPSYVHLLSIPVDIVADAFLAGFFEVFRLDDDMLVHGDEILTLDYELGHRNFSCWMFPTPIALSTAVKRT